MTPFRAHDGEHLRRTIELAYEARKRGNAPFGAVLVAEDGRILAEGKNTQNTEHDVTGHAETNLVRAAFRSVCADTLAASTLYASGEPCAMCSGAILLYGIPRVIIGENRTFTGEEELLRSRGVEVQVVQDPACIALMERFIAEHPALWNEDIGE